MTDPDLTAAWDELHAATPTGWRVRRPYLHDEHREWEQYAWLPSGPGTGRPARMGETGSRSGGPRSVGACQV